MPTRAFAFLLLGLLARSAGPVPVAAQDAYVWQRLWTPPVREAVRQSADLVRAWRVLVAEAGRGRWATAAVDWSVLKDSGRPVIAVIRIDGQLTPALSDALAADIGEIAAQAAQGMALAGIEIDHDCATARLAGYVQFLKTLRRHLPPGLPLSITALPAWLSTPLFTELAAQPDEIVLQVHAVRNPRFGLFDQHLALEWVETMARRTPRPFRVALPAYGSKVHWDGEGRLYAVESEAPTLAGSGDATELTASPTAVAALLRGLERTAPNRFAGVVWFRLPTSADGRAWSPQTWRTVTTGGALRTELRAELRDTATPGLQEAVLVNTGPIDAERPRALRLGRGCGPADGVNGYRLRPDGDRAVLEDGAGGMVRSGQHLVVGWARCAPAHRGIDVQP